jgi:hypothetical protein
VFSIPAVLFIIYAFSRLQMRGWLHEIEKFLETQISNKQLKKENNEGQKE